MDEEAARREKKKSFPSSKGEELALGKKKAGGANPAESKDFEEVAAKDGWDGFDGKEGAGRRRRPRAKN